MCVIFISLNKSSYKQPVSPSLDRTRTEVETIASFLPSHRNSCLNWNSMSHLHASFPLFPLFMQETISCHWGVRPLLWCKPSCYGHMSESFLRKSLRNLLLLLSVGQNPESSPHQQHRSLGNSFTCHEFLGGLKDLGSQLVVCFVPQWASLHSPSSSWYPVGSCPLGSQPKGPFTLLLFL